MKRPAISRCFHAGWWLLVAAALASAWPLRAADAAPWRTEFAAIALHDVVDDPAALDADSVTSDQLVGLLEWLAGNGWTAISLDDVERARSGIAPLPPKAVLITVDDGLASLYTRIYPLAMAYRMPVVAAVVGQWMDVPSDGTVRYGDRTLPRSAFISWEQAREMQASGWIEFASHSDALHVVGPANPQGSLLPVGQNRLYADGRYETAAQFSERIRADLARSRQRMGDELGRQPRALAWPYGRYNAAALDVARSLGFDFVLGLQAGPADATRPHAISRFIPTGDPGLATWVENLRFRDPWPALRRIVAFDTAQLAGRDAADTDARLGQAIERLVALGATDVMLDAGTVSADGRLLDVWFPNAQLSVREDVLGRLAAQMRARAGVDVIVRLPHRAALRGLQDRQRVLELYRDLAAQVPFEGLLLEDAPGLGRVPAAAADTPWQVARRRESGSFADWPDEDALALQAFLAAERGRPGLQAYWLAPAGHPLTQPSGLAEVTLVQRDPDAVGDDPELPVGLARRSGLFLFAPGAPTVAADEVARAARAFQVRGGAVIGWGPEDALAPLDSARALAPVVSARDFPPPREQGP